MHGLLDRRIFSVAPKHEKKYPSQGHSHVPDSCLVLFSESDGQLSVSIDASDMTLFFFCLTEKRSSRRTDRSQATYIIDGESVPEKGEQVVEVSLRLRRCGLLLLLLLG